MAIYRSQACGIVYFGAETTYDRCCGSAFTDVIGALREERIMSMSAMGIRLMPIPQGLGVKFPSKEAPSAG
jgi:hypothetical protein